MTTPTSVLDSSDRKTDTLSNTNADAAADAAQPNTNTNTNTRIGDIIDCFRNCSWRGFMRTYRPFLREIRLAYLLVLFGVLLFLLSDDQVFGFMILSLMAGVAIAICVRIRKLARTRQQLISQRRAGGAPVTGAELSGLPPELFRHINRTHLRLAMMDRDFNENGKCHCVCHRVSSCVFGICMC
jgi:hypothetical protein